VNFDFRRDARDAGTFRETRARGGSVDRVMREASWVVSL